MKKLILTLLLFGFIATGHSQILLKETKVEYRPQSMKLDPNSHQLVLKISETNFQEFETNPLAFVKSQFDIQKTIKDNSEEDYNSYRVSFKSTHGYLIANFNLKGDLTSSFQKFKNRKLPNAIHLQILQDYRDAKVLGTKYIATSRSWDLDKEIYKVKIMDGNKTRKLKIQKENTGLSFTEF